MKLNDVCKLIVDTEHKTAPRAEEGYPSIRTPNIGKGRFLLDGVYRVSEDTYKKWTRRAIPKPQDLILAREAPVGNVAIIPNGLNPCLGQRTVLLRPNEKIVSSKYLCYYLLSNEIQNEIQRLSSGATVAHLNMKDIRNLELGKVPPISFQNRIADILSAYDDLIENNLKKIKLLEQAAQNIYKEWFVNFRFPGHENTHMNEETGLPEGWEEKTLGEFTEINKGKNITKSTIIAGNVPVVAGGLKPAYYHSTSNTINPVITVSASGANAGYINIYLEDIWASDCSYIDSNLSDSVFFTHNLLLNHQELIFGMQRGAAQPHVYPKDLKRAEFVIPDKDLIQKFEEQVSPQYDMKRVLLNQNQKLKSARDILLPRLMNRTIEV